MVLANHLLNNMKGFKNFKKTGNLKHLHSSELDKPSFALDAGYSKILKRSQIRF